MKKFLGLLVFAMSVSSMASYKKINTETGIFKLPALPYAENSLEKAIDAQTMNIHHSKHHQAYVDNLNKALENNKLSLIQIISQISKYSVAVRNNAGGHWNHSFFWTVLSGQESDNKISSSLKKEIETKWGSMEKFQEEFQKAGTSQFGSGWVWLVRTANGLEITATPNQDNPLMDIVEKRGWPILAADVWEHAYYLKYQNKRIDYLKNFWLIVNWKMVESYDKQAKSTPLP